MASGNEKVRVIAITFLKGTMFTVEMRTIGTLLSRIRQQIIRIVCGSVMVFPSRRDIAERNEHIQ
eukprot:scaffold19599_cov54-Cylindrotheca_fusiformis.AAC.1